MNGRQKKPKRKISQRDVLTQVSEICEDLGAISPVEFLSYVVAGVDPRNVSVLYQYLHMLKNKQGYEPPDEGQWAKIIELLEETPCSFEPVDLSISVSSAYKLLEYMHPKKKAIEVSGEMNSIVGNVDKLEIEDIKKLRKAFDKEF